MRGRVTDDSSGMTTARWTPHIKARHVSGLREVTSLQAHHSMRGRQHTEHGRSHHQRHGRGDGVGECRGGLLLMTIMLEQRDLFYV